MKLAKTISLIVIILMMLSGMIGILNLNLQDVDTAINGVLNIGTSNEGKVVALNGSFKVVDGIVAPVDMVTTNDNVMWMNMDDIRLYDYPSGYITAMMTVRFDELPYDTLLIEEIYTMYRLYVDGQLVASEGQFGADESDGIMEKSSKRIHFTTLNNEVIVVLQINNAEQIDGQLKKFIFIGNSEDVDLFYNLRSMLKYTNLVFYATTALFLLVMYIRNRKHKYMLTLAVAGCLNAYIILTYFEPFVLFQPSGTWYLINSWLQPFPTLFTQFISALSIHLFIRDSVVYKHKRRFVRLSLSAMSSVVILVILLDKIAYPLYMLTLAFVIFFMIYTAIFVGRSFLNGRRFGLALYVAISAYIITYGALVYISLLNHDRQTLNYIPIMLMFGQMLFYGVMTYGIVSDFSRKFFLAEINETALEQLVEEKTVALKNSNDILRTSNERRRRLLSDISHDLRSPITVVKGYMELIQTGKINEGSREQYFQVIYDKMSFISDLVNDLLYLAKVEEYEGVQKDQEALDMIVMDLIDGHRDYKEHVVVDMAEDLTIYCNYNQVYRMITNLVDNAIEYSRDQQPITIRGWTDSTYVYLSIKDQGVGIDPEKIPHIFDRFVRNDATRSMEQKHFGLGLSIVKSIVDQHQAHIECNSIIDVGTEFKISFKKIEE